MALQDKKNRLNLDQITIMCRCVLITEMLRRLASMHQGLMVAKVTSETS